MKPVISICSLLLWTCGAVLAQSPKLKVFVSADMEGVAGVATGVQTSPKDREFGRFSRLMTLEVNAAIEGVYDAGATEVLVADSHGDGQNIDVELLDKRARLVRGMPRALGMMEGIDDTYDAVVFVGYHSGRGQANAILAHTNSGKIWEVKLNGSALPEAGFNAAMAGELGVPVVFISGDQFICDEGRRLFGPIETAVVKQARGFFPGSMMHPEEAQKLIRAGVKRGVERRRELKPFKLAHPVRVEVTFKDELWAEVASYLPGIDRPSGDVVSYTARDAIEAHKIYRAISTLDPVGR